MSADGQVLLHHTGYSFVYFTTDKKVVLLRETSYWITDRN